MPIAYHGVAMASANGAKHPKTEWFNPFEQVIKKTRAEQLIDRKSARIFMALAREGKLPSWVSSSVDIETIKLVASG